MRSHPARILEFAVLKSRLRLVLLTLAIMGGLASAQAGKTWQIDSKHSFAHLSLGVGSNALEVGVARVSGVMDIDPEDPADPTISFEIRPESKTVAEHAIISFTSEPATSRDGQLVFNGKLTITRIERSVETEPNEAYSGPQYGEAVVYTETRQVAFVFSDIRPRLTDDGAMELGGRVSVNREDFPELQESLTLDDWPTQLVNDEKCTAPPTIGEDFHGLDCTGSVVASVSNAEVPSGVGEAFYGFVPAVTPNLGWSSIVVSLRLERILSAPAAAASDSALPTQIHREKQPLPPGLHTP
ncbi:MAG: hypothetical protein ACLQLC_03255 [Candidatus Sulfotelmatobacter sp.]